MYHTYFDTLQLTNQIQLNQPIPLYSQFCMLRRYYSGLFHILVNHQSLKEELFYCNQCNRNQVSYIEKLSIVRPQLLNISLVVLNNISDYEQWGCQRCQETIGFTYCQWADQFNPDGGCLPNVGDGANTPCSSEDGDVIVETCPGKS